MAKTYTYVVRNDGGAAPCYERGLLTLAVCKPGVRRSAQPGDLVFAYNGRDLLQDGPHRVRWAGMVEEKVLFADYWRDSRFTGRADNIYEPVEGAPPEPATGAFRHNGSDLHPEEVHWGHDLDGRWVLVFERWWYFGDNGPEAPERLRMTIHRRGHRVFDGAPVGWLEESFRTSPRAPLPVMPQTAARRCGSAARARPQPRKKGGCPPPVC